MVVRASLQGVLCGAGLGILWPEGQASDPERRCGSREHGAARTLWVGSLRGRSDAPAGAASGELVYLQPPGRSCLFKEP